MSLMPLTGIFISEEGKSAMKVMMKGILIALALLPAPPAVAGETLGDMSTPCFNPYASKEDHQYCVGQIAGILKIVTASVLLYRDMRGYDISR